jgi:hypothetical protein
MPQHGTIHDSLYNAFSYEGDGATLTPPSSAGRGGVRPASHFLSGFALALASKVSCAFASADLPQAL